MFAHCRILHAHISELAELAPCKVTKRPGTISSLKMTVTYQPSRKALREKAKLGLPLSLRRCNF